MQSVAVFLVLVAAASANVFRVPSADSAVISSQRVGGNFAYSTQEGQAYGVVSPVVSHVTSPVATTFTVQQPSQVVSNVNVVPTTYTVQNQAQVVSHVQQPATVVSTGTPVATTYTTGAVQQQNVWPVTQQVATTYGSYPYAYSYGGIIAPSTYSAIQSNVVGVDAQKEINQVNQVQVQNVEKVEQVQPQTVTYTVQQPQAQTWAVQQPQAQTWAVQQPQAQTWAVQQPQIQSWAVQQPQTYTVHNQHQGSVVATGTPSVATTYAVQQPISVVAAGTPASTFKTVAGASPLGFNTWAYGTGQPWGYNVVA